MTRPVFASARLATLHLCVAAFAFAPDSGHAHATLEIREAPANATYKATLRVPHGCKGEATETLAIQIPDGVISVKPMPKADWTLETDIGPYSKPYDNHGTPISEGVREIRWTGGSLLDAHYDEFVFRGWLTDFAPGTRIAFPAVQTCASGEVAWTEIATDGQDPHALERPAPSLTIAQAEADGHAHHTDGVTAAIGTARIGDIAIEGAWTRQTPPRATVGGAYMTLRNEGAEDDVLLGGTVAFAERLEVHEMAVADGVMTMRMLPDGLPVPAGETVSLEPGGLHVMFIGIKETPMEGGTVDVTLSFAKAGEITLSLPIAAIGARGIDGDAGEDSMHGTSRDAMNHDAIAR